MAGDKIETGESLSIRWLWLRFLVAGICSFPFFLGHLFGLKLSFGLQGILTTFVQIFSGGALYFSAYKALRKLQINRDTLRASALLIAYFLSFYALFVERGRPLYFEIATLLTPLILLAEIIESIGKQKGIKEIRKWGNRFPQRTQIWKGGSYVDLPVSELSVGDLFLVEPRELIAADGEVVEGDSCVDESMIVGHRQLIEKNRGDSLFAGTLNQHSRLVVLASQVAGETSLAKRVGSLKSARESRGAIDSWIDQGLTYFIPAILAIALLTWIFWSLVVGNSIQGFLSATTLLLLASPGAFQLAILPHFTACLEGAKRGIWIRDQKTVELMAKIKQIGIDAKAVTEGSFAVEKTTVDPLYFPIIYTLAIQTDQTSIGVIGQFLRDRQVTSIPQMEVFRAIEGGVSGFFDGRKYFLGSPQFLEEQGVPLNQLGENLELKEGIVIAFGTEKLAFGYFVLSDPIREGVKEAVAALKKLKIETILLSKSSPLMGKKMAEKVGFDKWMEESSFKGSIEGEKVAVVGNDLKRLHLAHIGFIMGGDLGMGVSSVAIRESNLQRVVEAILLAKAARGKVLQNLAFAICYNGIAIAFGVIGFIPPIWAALLLVASSSFVRWHAPFLQRGLSLVDLNKR